MTALAGSGASVFVGEGTARMDAACLERKPGINWRGESAHRDAVSSTGRHAD